MTAEASAADTDTAHDLRLITDTNLAQFDTCLEYRSQILYQLTEINSSVCCKVKKDFIVVKCIFRINQLHLKTMLPDLFKTNLKCFFFFNRFAPVMISMIPDASPIQMDKIPSTMFPAPVRFIVK